MSRQAARAKLPKPTKAHASVLFYLRKKPLTADAKPLCIFSCGEQIQRDEQAGKTALLCTSIMIIDELIIAKTTGKVNISMLFAKINPQ